MKKLSKQWTTVTPLSKGIALAMFILLPFLAFYLGLKFQSSIDIPIIQTIGATCGQGKCAPFAQVKK